MNEQEIQKAKFEFVERRKREWLDETWDRLSEQIEREIKRKIKREEWQPTGAALDEKLYRFGFTRYEEKWAEVNRLLEVLEPRWEAQFDEEKGEAR